jgi:hypothetical protein
LFSFFPSLESENIAKNVFSYLVTLNSRASDVVKNGYTYVQEIPTFNFETYEQMIDNDLTLSNNLLGNVTAIGKEVTIQ